MEDRNKGEVNLRDLSISLQFFDDLNLIDPPLHSWEFNWTNDQAKPLWIRLDWFLYSHNWFSINPRSYQYVLSRFGLDHSPISLDFGYHSPHPQPFWFEKTWYSNGLLGDLIEDRWTSSNFKWCRLTMGFRELSIFKYSKKEFTSGTKYIRYHKWKKNPHRSRITLP